VCGDSDAVGKLFGLSLTMQVDRIYGEETTEEGMVTDPRPKISFFSLVRQIQ
jgi:hypothetical protein